MVVVFVAAEMMTALSQLQSLMTLEGAAVFGLVLTCALFCSFLHLLGGVTTLAMDAALSAKSS